ncbi:uncharacterized membrane-anchored protein YjiN (DUF445 family) [Paraburkholderia bannensis]|uniref:Uncharacterized membrane-anchored protein YjiN (DUF445 family) n=1 Tax=Paraburkholderia bannensis TaxID=765414 RepID=A0A7W9WRE6_9BURK|nr:MULTISPECIES: DUF445 domain-containing protein [Paraburkholderia]MBB3256142.1 uncharacterized membrane-anchored protein YjiN (DUF445 family) [Paraburkholderia sp. WP4_3_2]MBB6101142.1 uncharacterized membrane-anchored protein YjiN (DUF445 family) [Paraburkholderia bannensis]
MPTSEISRDEAELMRAKRRALLFLIAAAVVFVVTALSPPGVIVDGIKAVSEAAMVGALADWFAVVALFRRVPIPFVAARTGVIPRNKDRIADELAVFVQEKFLDVNSLVGLIRRHDPVERLSGWLTAPQNAQRLGDYAVRLMSGLLGLTDDARIQAFIRDALHAALDKVDLSKSAGAILDTLTKDGRHQELLDRMLDQLGLLLAQESTRIFVASRIVDGLKGEFPKTEKYLPSDWLGDKGARVLESAVNRLLLQVSEDREHHLRQKFDEVMQKLIVQLKSDPAFLRKGEELKASLREGSALNDYTRELWGSLRAWLRDDLDQPGSTLHAKVAATGQWLGEALAADADLRASINSHLEDAARAMAPEFSRYLTHHIRDTVRNWDTRETARLIELKIGKDLQEIRVNGTVIGGTIGLGLYLCSHLFEWLRLQLGL